MYLLLVIPLLSLVSTGDAFWPSLRVTFGLNPFGDAFTAYPLTAEEASNTGWQQISDCSPNATWLGNRYADPRDPSLVLIYDEAGYIAGSQSGMTKASVDENLINFSKNEAYQEGGFFWCPCLLHHSLLCGPSHHL